MDNSVAPKAQRLSALELEAVVQLLIAKDAELKKTIRVRIFFKIDATML